LILSDRDILRSIRLGQNGMGDGIRIDPFRPEAVQPASVDLSLGRVYWRFRKPPLWQRLLRCVPPIDPREGVKPGMRMERFEADEVVLEPFSSVLASVRERTYVPRNMTARVEGKSSLGRILLIVHTTAGFIDAGNDLNITLEIVNLNRHWPIRIYKGQWISQLAYELMTSEAEKPYAGRYKGDDEAAPSRINLNPGVGE